jgi:hypothetical protein
MILAPLTERATLHARIEPVPRDFLQRVRGENRDDLGQPIQRLRAKGGEPCRDAFRRAAEGEELILASFSPFTRIGPYREYGPIFVLANDTARTPPDILSIGGPSDYLREQFVIRAYSRDEEIVDAKLLQASSAQETINSFFARDDVAFLHVRFPTYGCFACRLERRV